MRTFQLRFTSHHQNSPNNMSGMSNPPGTPRDEDVGGSYLHSFQNENVSLITFWYASTMQHNRQIGVYCVCSFSVECIHFFVSFCLDSSTLLPWPWASDASLFAPFWKLTVGHRWHRQSTCTGNGIGWDCPASSLVVSCNIKMNIFFCSFYYV